MMSTLTNQLLPTNIEYGYYLVSIKQKRVQMVLRGMKLEKCSCLVAFKLT